MLAVSVHSRLWPCIKNKIERIGALRNVIIQTFNEYLKGSIVFCIWLSTIPKDSPKK